MNHHKIIQAFPSLDLRKLFARRKDRDPVLTESRVQLYASGRAAIFHAVKSLNLQSGSVILLPSFNCGVEVEAVLKAGYQVDFFRIKRDLSVDIDHVIKKISSSTKVIIVAHYYGFPQDLSELIDVCRRRDIVLIEDCAHALYSQSRLGQWLGTEGDIGLYSMRKTVFLPNGGALLVNRNDYALPDKGKFAFNPGLFKVMIKSALEKEKDGEGRTAEFSGALLAFYENYKSEAAKSERACSGESERWYYDVPMYDYENDISAISMICAGKDDCKEIIALRRKNYGSLEKNLTAHHAKNFVFADLPDGTCPLCFPLFVDQSDAVVARMIKRGVAPYVFGRRPHPLVNREEFPEITSLSESIIGLPVHQQLSEGDMEIVADVLIESL